MNTFQIKKKSNAEYADSLEIAHTATVTGQNH